MSKIVVCKLLKVWKGLKFVVWEGVNSIPNNKISDWTKLEAFADDKINAKVEMFLKTGKIHCRKGKKCWFPHNPTI